MFKFFTEKKWFLWAYLGSAIILSSLWITVQIDVMINEWFGEFYDMIQKALGAKNSFIMLQFLAESIVLCVFGGIVGLILMSILVLIVNMWSDSFTLVIFWSNLVIGVVISAVIGLVSGILPAYTASRLNPVDAIRSK